MSWIQLKIKTTAENAEQISEYLQELGSLAVTYQDAGDEALYEPPLDKIVLWNEIFITALFPENVTIDAIVSALKERINAENLDYSIDIISDQAWEKAWMSNFQPMQFGERLWIIPSYSPLDNPPPHHVILDPGLAFGTGTHPTTALCLEWLDKNLKPGAKVVDYGCGSGILAIAALKLGASKVWAVDHDPQALAATQENAVRNQIQNNVLELFLPGDLPSLQVDVVMANILANPLIQLANTFHNMLKQNGIIVLSGILQDQTNLVCEKYQKYFAIQQIDSKEEWIRIEGRSLGPSP